MLRRVSLLCGWLALTSGAVGHAATINIGNYTLLPNMANQSVVIPITGSDTNVTGLDLYLLVGDGGPQLSTLGLVPGTAAPVITGVDITSAATIFANKNVGQSDLINPSLPQFAGWETAASGSNTVSDSGTLAILTFNTTGFTSGSWPLNLDFTLHKSSDNSALVFQTELDLNGSATFPTVNAGSISIAVPEPETWALAAIALAAAAAWRARWGRVRLAAPVRAG